MINTVICPYCDGEVRTGFGYEHDHHKSCAFYGIAVLVTTELSPAEELVQARQRIDELEESSSVDSMGNPLHSNKSAEWYTPKPWVDKVREVLGTIELDPASSEEAQKVVQADRYYTAIDDGLSQPWRAETVFLNPPSGRGAAKAWFGALWSEYMTNNVKAAIYLAYNLEQIRYLDTGPYSMTVAVPNKRISFVGAGKSPTHSNAFILLGDSEYEWRFIETFIGSCKIFHQRTSL